MMTKRFILLIIRLYQKTLSPDHGLLRPFFAPGACIYRPTCSEYAYNAIRQCGVVCGVILGVKRLARCHPWREGGYDPISRPNRHAEFISASRTCPEFISRSLNQVQGRL